MFVKNLNGTGDRTCRCGNWLRHWENFAHQTARYCSASDCSGFAQYGGHVVKVGTIDQRHFIIPLCPSCNAREGAFETAATLVSANVSETCG
jgi:hypothetical protein